MTQNTNSNYKNIAKDADIDDIREWAIDVTRTRRFDIEDEIDEKARTPKIFDAPDSMTDIIGTEKKGDLAIGISGGQFYVYFVVDNFGDLEWRRVLLSSF